MASASVTSVSWRKRSHEEDALTEIENKRPKMSYYFRLESESSLVDTSDSDTESIYSIQDRVTDTVRDTSDTDSKSDSYDVEVEYEVASIPDSDEDKEKCVVYCNSSSESENMMIVAAVVADSSLETITDTEDSDSCQADTSLGRRDFWTCLQCKSQNNNPQFRFCEKCFQDRKAFFPPRPKGFRKTRPTRKRCRTSSKSKRFTGFRLSEFVSRDSGIGSQDSGVSSQDLVGGSNDSGVISHDSGISSQDSGISSQDSGAVSQDIGGGSQDCGTSSQESGVSSQDLYSSQECLTPVHLINLPDTEEEEQQEPSTSKSVIQPVKGIKRERQPSESSISEWEVPAPKRRPRTEQPETCDNRTHSDGISPAECKELCMICNFKPKNSIFLHGRTAHMCSCYTCAIRTWRINKKCPICSRKIHNVVKVYVT